jgi:hypothetical protein
MKISFENGSWNDPDPLRSYFAGSWIVISGDNRVRSLRGDDFDEGAELGFDGFAGGA